MEQNFISDQGSSLRCDLQNAAQNLPLQRSVLVVCMCPYASIYLSFIHCVLIVLLSLSSSHSFKLPAAKVSNTLWLGRLEAHESWEDLTQLWRHCGVISELHSGGSCAFPYLLWRQLGCFSFQFLSTLVFITLVFKIVFDKMFLAIVDNNWQF